jgi:hypothetical protein
MTPQEIEIERLKIEKDRLELDKAQAALERKLLNKHLGAVITASVSLAAIFVSIGQIYSAKLSAENQLRIQELSAENQLKIQDSKNKSDENISRAQLILTHINQINNPDANERQLATSAFILALGLEKAKELFDVIEKNGSSVAKEAANQGQKEIEDVRQVRLMAWNGRWSHTFTSSLGEFTGSMTLETKDDGSVAGSFDAKNRSILGSIRGQLSYDRTIMKGDWQNNLGQRGHLLFILNSDQPSTFEGNYSLFEAEPAQGASLRWKGSKTNTH